MRREKQNLFNRKKIITAFIVVTIASIIGGIQIKNLDKIPYSPTQYQNLINKLKADGYTFVLPKDLGKTNATKIAVIVHDCDYSLNGAKVFIKTENESGIRSAFFLRPDPDSWNTTNYFPQNIQYFRSLESQGWEIGFHYDCLSRGDGNWTFAMQLFKAQLVYMREFFNITTTRSHGDVFYNNTFINGVRIYNGWLYQHNMHTWQDLCLVDASDWTGLVDSSSLNQTAFYSDSGFHTWNIPANINARRVMINLHTDWWSENPGHLGYIFG